jgi:hypothetical protein
MDGELAGLPADAVAAALDELTPDELLRATVPHSYQYLTERDREKETNRCADTLAHVRAAVRRKVGA